jgi:hypothetical protein
MNRINFLRSLGLAGGAIVSAPYLAAAKGIQDSSSARGGCVLIPSETPGPFPLDLTDNNFYFRQDITEGYPGTPMVQRLRILGLENCLPMPNVRVNLWCCDALGRYSGYGDQEGTTYMRGYQITDDNGEVEFHSIFPGWYPGRVVHMHFQVHVSTCYSAVSQYTWPHDTAVAIANDDPELYPEGPDPLTPETDGAFADGYENQLATLEWDKAAGTYTSFLEVTVNGAGVDGVGYLEGQAAQVFTVGQNSPNPATSNSTIPLQLHRDAEVELGVWSISGQKVYSEDFGTLPSGNHNLSLQIEKYGMSAGAYVYQLNVKHGGRIHNDLKRFIVQ